MQVKRVVSEWLALYAIEALARDLEMLKKFAETSNDSVTAFYAESSLKFANHILNEINENTFSAIKIDTDETSEKEAV